jgi:hypothetical protein
MIDETMLCYNKLDFIPYNDIERPHENGIYNLFTGFNPQIKTVYDKSKSAKILSPFLDLGLQLCENNTNYHEYTLKFFAQMIQFPEIKLPICPVFTGPQGIGKNVFFGCLANVISKQHFISSSNMEDFFGTHAEGFFHKLLANIDEMNGSQTKKYEDILKTSITSEIITVNPKGIRPFELVNYARSIGSTNTKDPFPIDFASKERRYYILLGTDHYLQKKFNSAFWTALTDYFKKPEFIACLYDYLNEMDISKVDWRKERPITETYKKMQKASVPKEVLFLTNYILTKLQKKKGFAKDDAIISIDCTIVAKQMYDDFVIYSEENGFYSDRSFKMSNQKFYAKLLELSKCISEVDTGNQKHIRLNPTKVYKEFILKGWVNKNEEEADFEIEIEADDLLDEEMKNMFDI